ncbi:hypothetical protein [Kordia sp.]|uniref:hypothetical protein n=1 Tax=Kordia sp. TaxID=1965332 RepID=UPI003D6ACC70
MDFIHFIDKSKLNLVLKNGIKVTDCYRGKGILIYPNKEISFKTYSSEPELIKDEKLSNKLSIDKKWEKIGALGLRQNGKTVYGIKVEVPNSCWPLKVFINIQHQIAKEFGKLLDEIDASGIKYLTGETLTEVINRIKSPQFTLEGLFIINSENDLKEFIEIFQKAGGGIWSAHSFDCMIQSDISAKSVKEIIE